jgi:mannitol/fructose-specific phosphotransferase system IIA component (Ntr-type)
VKVQELLQRPRILLDVQAKNKEALITTLGRLLASNCGFRQPDLAIQRILERESEVSTGIGFGIAIPHCRIEGLSHPCMVAARAAEGIEYDALDGQPVRLVFMMVSPTNTSVEHGEILKSLSQIVAVESTREKLLSADTPEEFARIVTDAENALT